MIEPASAREGTPVRASVSRTWVAQIVGTWLASQSHKISSCSSARRSNPTSTARSPRAIMTASGGLFRPSRSMRDKFSKASRFSILSTTPMSGRPSRSSSSCSLRTSSGVRTNDRLTASECLAMKASARRSASVMLGTVVSVSGRLMPFSARSLAVSFCVRTTRRTNVPRFFSARSTTVRIRPSSVTWPSRLPARWRRARAPRAFRTARRPPRAFCFS